jgi:hypothetical protein
MIERTLDAGGVEFLLVGLGDAVGGGAELGFERGTDGRKVGLGDGAGVLRVQRGRSKDCG